MHGGLLSDIALHLDDAPVVRFHKGTCNRGRGGSGGFFFQQDAANHDYMNASESSEKHVTGYNYLAKICG